ncbi:MAG TPA: hypothetical protein VJ302_38590 [Blastocatellia bacterium]|nr:hypothetical protein [Blastocatellia bacterium]
MGIKRDALGIACVASAILWLLIAPGTSFAQKKKVNLDTLIAETQKSSPQSERLALVWWIPEEYWRASLAETPSVTLAQIDQFVAALRPYTIFIVVDGQIMEAGRVAYTSEEEIRKSIRLTDREGVNYGPLNDEAVDAGTKALLTTMKPILANILGPLGQNTYFVLFPGRNRAGKAIAEAAREGAFSLKLAEAEYKWKLPLASLPPPEPAVSPTPEPVVSRAPEPAVSPAPEPVVPRKMCPVDGEELNPDWKFCPLHGERLVGKSPRKVCPVDGEELNGDWKFCPRHGEKLLNGKTP